MVRRLCLGCEKSALALVLLAVLAPSRAWAQDASLDEARTHFEEGVARYEKNDFLGALEAFAQADRRKHVPAITYNIARARESLGQVQDAIDAYESYLAEAGAEGDYLAAATVALTTLKARASKLRVETTPPGANVRIDGRIWREKTPTTIWVSRGYHRVDVELQEWRAGADIDAEGNGKEESVVLQCPSAPDRPAAAPKRLAPTYDGLVAGLGLSLNYAALVVKAERPSRENDDGSYQTTSLRFGLVLEVGYALSPRSVVSVKGDCGLGSTEKALFSLGLGSVVYAWRATEHWWISAGGIMGSSDELLGATYTPLFGPREDKSIVLGSKLAIGPVVGTSVAIGRDGTGEWTMGIHPSLLLGTGQEQSTLFVPVVVGRRWF
ncbi:MAG TPA: PEGA domain-containing protein [Polyangiaceae bacterium]|nr:PEGA domain-containing protein [Polyangiaceae bacterium]